jgi:hypothetical protein
VLNCIRASLVARPEDFDVIVSQSGYSVLLYLLDKTSPSLLTIQAAEALHCICKTAEASSAFDDEYKDLVYRQLLFRFDVWVRGQPDALGYICQTLNHIAITNPTRLCRMFGGVRQLLRITRRLCSDLSSSSEHAGTVTRKLLFTTIQFMLKSTGCTQQDHEDVLSEAVLSLYTMTSVDDEFTLDVLKMMLEVTRSLKGLAWLFDVAFPVLPPANTEGTSSHVRSFPDLLCVVFVCRHPCAAIPSADASDVIGFDVLNAYCSAQIYSHLTQSPGRD